MMTNKVEKETALNVERSNKRVETARTQKSSFMSNSKWFKFFDTIKTLNIYFPKSKIKFLADEKIYEFYLPVFYEENYIEDMFGVAKYKEIEWLFIPAIAELERFNRDEKLASTFKKVDIQSIENMLNKLGNYKYEILDKGLKLYGYL